MPEARIILAQATTYLASSEKSNAAYMAINKAMSYVSQQPAHPVPLHLRNAPSKLMKQMGYGKGYKYSHDYEGSAGNQQFLPDDVKDERFYHPKEKGSETKLKRFLDQQWNGRFSR